MFNDLSANVIENKLGFCDYDCLITACITTDRFITGNKTFLLWSLMNCIVFLDVCNVRKTDEIVG